MARRRRGGFASGTFGAGPSAGPNQTPTTVPAAADPQRRPRRSNRSLGQRLAQQQARANKRERRSLSEPTEEADTGAPGFDDPFEGPDNRLSAARGMFNQAGVDFGNPFGQNSLAWLDDQLEEWARETEGAQIWNNSTTTPSWRNKLASIDQGSPLNPPGGPPPALAPLVDFDGWVRQQTGTAAGQLNPQRLRRLRELFDAEVQRIASHNANLASTLPAGPPTTTHAALDVADLTALTRDYQAATPLSRGYDSRAYRAPRRVIQF